MTTHFRYVPTSGPIDGASFISQTEIAINELGGDISTVKTSADTALDTANRALATAGEALITGQDAFTAAQKAQTTANTARTEAATAQSTGDNAQTRADDAYDLAATGVSDAGNAQTAADAAQATANQALIEAKSAQSTADQAVTMGESAQQAAHLAMGVYTKMNEPVEADEEFDSARKWIVTNTESTGFPLPAPLYLTVVVAEDGSTATQTVWSLDGGPTFSRTASITLAPPVEEGEVQEDDTAIWSEWFETAGKEDLEATHVLAEKAENDATTAQATGKKALGTYETDDTAVDADTLYAEADKRYLTGAYITNFPIPAPFYFDVMVNSDNTSVCQKVWSADDTAPKVTYIRLGTATDGIPTWQRWAPMGTTGSVTPYSTDADYEQFTMATDPATGILYQAVQPSGPHTVAGPQPLIDPAYWVPDIGTVLFVASAPANTGAPVVNTAYLPNFTVWKGHGLNMVDRATGRFTVPVNGFYEFTTQVFMNADPLGSTEFRGYVDLLVDGAMYEYFHIWANVTSVIGGQIRFSETGTVYATKGQQIWPVYYSGTTSSKNGIGDITISQYTCKRVGGAQ